LSTPSISFFRTPKNNAPGGHLGPAQMASLHGVLRLIQQVPDELQIMSAEQYADLILSISVIEMGIQIWTSQGHAAHGGMAPVKDNYDPVTIIRRILAQCSDEYPPPSSTADLLFINDLGRRESLRRDIGAAHRALNNNEWKAATVLGGAAIEALLHARLAEPKPTPAEVSAAISTLNTSKKFQPPSSQDDWVLYHFIAVAEELKLLKPNTAKAADLARDFRNLIHPGAEVREKQPCDRATAHSAIAALEHVIRDLS
jgi:hypothetical protein